MTVAKDMRWLLGAALSGLALAVGGCGEDADTDGSSATTAAADPPAAAAGASEVTCADATGDAQAMQGQAADDQMRSAADMVEVSLTATSAGVTLDITYAAALSAGNRATQLVLSNTDAGYPNADVLVQESEGLDPRVLVTTRRSQGDLTDPDTSDLVVSSTGAMVQVTVPLEVLGPVVDAPWEWEAQTTASASGQLAQDACGSTDAGTGSQIVRYPAPTTT